MSTEANVQIVKDFFAAMGSGDKQGLLALAAENIEWIIPGEGWPLAGTHRGHAELAAVLRKAFEEVEMTYPEPVVARYSFRESVLRVEGIPGGGPAYPIRDSDSPVTRARGVAILA